MKQHLAAQALHTIARPGTPRTFSGPPVQHAHHAVAGVRRERKPQTTPWREQSPGDDGLSGTSKRKNLWTDAGTAQICPSRAPSAPCEPRATAALPCRRAAFFFHVVGRSEVVVCHCAQLSSKRRLRSDLFATLVRIESQCHLVFLLNLVASPK